VSSFRVAVLASGAGTNLQSILDRLHGREGIEVVAVASDKPRSAALGRARDAGVDAAAFPAGEHPDREARDLAIAAWLDAHEIDLVVLAGYMQLLCAPFIARFSNQVINVHPALLPSFPGLDPIGQALDHGAKITGVTVHYVDEGVDTGPIILQQPVPVPADRDRGALERAIHATEHALLPEAIRMIAAGRVRVDDANPRLVRIAPAEDS
jgi:phosphoribosylglycinamide formyltransferase-1